jgi:hypothetical protein
MKPFQYIVVQRPTKKEIEEGDATPKIIVEQKTVLARDETGAQLLASRAIPEDYMEHPERIDIFIRPF